MEGCPLVVEGQDRNARGHQRTPLRPGDDVLRHSLDLLRRIRQGQDDGPLAPLAQRLDDILREGAVIRRRSDQDRRADAANGLQQADRAVLALPVGDLGGAARVGRLVIGQPVHVIGHQSGAVDQPDAVLRLLGRQSSAHHARMDLIGHASSRGARAVDKEALVREGRAVGLHARNDSGDDDRSGALHVVVEDAVLVPVVDEDAARV